jgi:hypothetical protein
MATVGATLALLVAAPDSVKTLKVLFVIMLLLKQIVTLW